MDKICFPTRDGGRICVPIFVQIVTFPPPGPDPERSVLAVALNPQPEPPGLQRGESWIEAAGIDRAMAGDLSAVAAVRLVADRMMSAEMRKAAEPALRGLADAMQARLPRGATYAPVESQT